MHDLALTDIFFNSSLHLVKPVDGYPARTPPAQTGFTEETAQ